MATFSVEQIREYGRRLIQISEEIDKLHLISSCGAVHELFFDSPRDASTWELAKKWNGMHNAALSMNETIWGLISRIGYSIEQYANTTIENEEDAAVKLGTSADELNSLYTEFKELQVIIDNESDMRDYYNNKKS